MSESLSNSPVARVGVVTSPGVLDNVDTARAVRLVRAEPVSLRREDTDLCGVDAVVAPGGFSYGGYLHCGAIARFAPVMEEVVTVAERGVPVLDIHNDFRILAEAHLLPGASLRNTNQCFICVEQRLRMESTQTVWINWYVDKDEIVVPMKSGEGNFIVFPEKLDRLGGEGLVVFHCMSDPNGSARDIADVRNKHGNVVGLIPHPGHAAEPGFGLDSQIGPRTGTNDLGVFRPVIGSLLII